MKNIRWSLIVNGLNNGIPTCFYLAGLSEEYRKNLEVEERMRMKKISRGGEGKDDSALEKRL